MFDKNYIEKELENGLSLSEIATKSNFIYYKLYYWCKKNNINISRKTNGKSNTTLKARKKSLKIKNNDAKLLKELYIDKGWSVHKIGNYFNTTGATVTSALRRFKIPVKLSSGKFERRSPSFDKKTLYHLYVEKGLSMQEITDLLGYKNHGIVNEDLKYYNIPRRTYKEAGECLYEKHPEKRDLHRNQFYEGITGPRKDKVTSLENEFMNWAKNNEIDFIYQFQIRKTWHRYDFLIKETNIIIEMDGYFWHRLPEHVERDNQFDKTAERYGYKVIRIKELELKDNPNLLNEKILPHIKEND